MARPLRLEYEGAFYHVFNRGLEKRSIFLKEEDYKHFLSRCHEAHLRYQIVIHAYCLMPNHYHLLIETPIANLQKAMKHLNGSYTQYFNRVNNRRVGPLFQGRYKALLVEKDAYFLQLSRYIHLNPVKARLATGPKEYQYSSYRHFFSGKNQPEFLATGPTLDYFNASKNSACSALHCFTLEGIAESFDPYKACRAGALLGSDDFVNEIREKYIQIETTSRDSEMPQVRQLKKTVNCSKCVKVVQSTNAPTAIKKKLLIYTLKKFTPMTLKEIQEKTKMASYHAVFKAALRAKDDKKIRSWIQEVEKKMSHVKT